MSSLPPLQRILSSTLLSAFVGTAGLACRPVATQPPAVTPPALGDVHEDPRFTARLRIFDAAGVERTLPSVLDELAEANVVFFGETHSDDTTHTLEHAVFAGLAARREGQVTLSLEMFERDVQPVLDEYAAGKIDEDWFLARARPWPNYRTGYRALVLAAKQAGAPIIAANTPRALLRGLGGRDEAAFTAAKTEHPEQLPAVMLPPSEAYQQRVGRALRGHGPAMAQGDATWSVQNYWDNTMADAVARARTQWPDRAVVHYAGGFHVERHDGTVAQFAKRRPTDAVKTILAVPTSDLATAHPDATLADFVAYVRADASGPEGGALAVSVPGALQWHVSLPAAHKEGATHPLVIVLPDHDERPVDALVRWRARLSDTAVLAVVVPPQRQQTDLGWIERRWMFPGSFAEDLGPLVAGLPRLVDYAQRLLPVAPGRPTLVGEGVGGAAVLWATLYGDDLAVDAIAVVPTLPPALQHAALPDDDSAVNSLTLVIEGRQPEALAPVLDGLAQVGVTPLMVQLAADSPTLGRDRAAVVARHIGAPVPALSPKDPTVLVVGGLAPHGRAWARTLAAQWEAAGIATVLAESSQSPRAVVLGAGSPQASQWVADALRGSALPRPEASFGGGTVVVLPGGMPDRVVAAWRATVQAATAERGRFAPIRIVTEGTGELREAVLSIQAEGWADVLVVPAVFAAHPALMRRLQDGAADLPADVTVQWLPGFGAAVAEYRAAPEAAPKAAATEGTSKPR